MSQTEYWNDRANMEYTYKGEKFYTITAIPYYYRRRKIILHHINSLICDNFKICDFGCGDGEYIRVLSEKTAKGRRKSGFSGGLRGGITFHGVDISNDMIRIAKSRNKSDRYTWEISGDGIHKDELFHLVYSSAVFAHIPDETVVSLFSNIASHIINNGYFVLCEQTAPFRYSGATYTRRPMSEYVELLKKTGFKNFQCFTIDFWLHRLLFERKIGKFFINYYAKKYGETNIHIAMVNLNKNRIYRFLSGVCAVLSFPKIFKKKDRWGYCFIVSKK